MKCKYDNELYDIEDMTERETLLYNAGYELGQKEAYEEGYADGMQTKQDIYWDSYNNAKMECETDIHLMKKKILDKITSRIELLEKWAETDELKGYTAGGINELKKLKEQINEE